jgi:hypothetical protein
MVTSEAESQLRGLIQRFGSSKGRVQPVKKELFDFCAMQIDEWLYKRKLTPLKMSESAVIAIGKEKTAALCFHRVWSAEEPQIGFTLKTNAEALFVLNNVVQRIAEVQIISEGLNEETKCSPIERHEIPISRELFDEFLDLQKNALPLAKQIGMFILLDGMSDGKGRTEEEMIDGIRYTFFPKHLAHAMSKTANVPVMPIFRSGLALSQAYQSGDHSAALAIVSDIDIVSEAELTWAQVQEFRSDSESRVKYKRFIHWLDKDMVGKPLSFIEDELSIRLDQYRYALRKHGILTVSGALRSILDWKSLTTALGAAYGIAVGAGSFSFGAMAGASITLGKVAVEVIDIALKREDLKHNAGYEIAFAHELMNIGN